MELVFVDESGDVKFKNYLGLCVATVSHANYRTIKEQFQRILVSSAWDQSVEFKGSHLFSASKGDLAVSIEDRIEIARKVLDLNQAAKNARLRFHYSHAEAADQKGAYLKMLPQLLSKALSPARKGWGKDLVTVSCDFRSDISPSEIRLAIQPTLEARGYTLVEEVQTPTSNFETVGILYADIAAYLLARIDTISNDSDLFGLTAEEIAANGKLLKLKSSQQLTSRIKALRTYAEILT